MQASNLFEKLEGRLELKITQQSAGLFDVGLFRGGVKTELSAEGVANGEVGRVADELQELARRVPGMAGTAQMLARAKRMNKGAARGGGA